MSGHSKWSTIKHKKAITDAKRANVFTKLAKEVTIAARDGGDPEMNFKLRIAIDKAKAGNMPKENIERAIKRGTGELKDGIQIEQAVYEAYGPGNIAMLIQIATDNKNRTYSEIKSMISKNGGKMVEGGSVSWQFEQVGALDIESINQDEDVEMMIIESGAKDYLFQEKAYEVFTAPSELQKVKKIIEEAGYEIADAELRFKPKETIEVDAKTFQSYQKLKELLEEHDDVSEIFDNLKYNHDKQTKS